MEIDAKTVPELFRAIRGACDRRYREGYTDGFRDCAVLCAREDRRREDDEARHGPVRPAR